MTNEVIKKVVVPPAQSNPNAPTPVTTDSSQPREFTDLQYRLEEAYRTDYITLPAPPVPDNLERQRVSAMEREIILHPEASGDTIVDDKGTTLAEYREQIQLGVMPKDAPQEALDSIGKHSIELRDNGDGTSSVIVNPPNDVDRPVIISEPKVQDKTDTDFGSELVHSTTAVPESTQEKVFTKEEQEEAVSKGKVAPSSTAISPTKAPSPITRDVVASSPSDVPIDENTRDRF